MPTRFICPHCHSPIDPAAMELASSERAYYRICPVCDEAVLVALVAGLAVADPQLASGAPTAREYAA